jgi:hypothetical protein
MAAFDSARSGWIYPTHHDARYPAFVTVYYPLHLLYGRGSLRVRQRFGVGGVAQYVVEMENIIQSVPVWMTDEAYCSRLTFGLDPLCAMRALLELQSLLQSSRVKESGVSE